MDSEGSTHNNKKTTLLKWENPKQELEIGLAGLAAPLCLASRSAQPGSL